MVKVTSAGTIATWTFDTDVDVLTDPVPELLVTDGVDVFVPATTTQTAANIVQCVYTNVNPLVEWGINDTPPGLVPRRGGVICPSQSGVIT